MCRDVTEMKETLYLGFMKFVYCLMKIMIEGYSLEEAILELLVLYLRPTSS